MAEKREEIVKNSERITISDIANALHISKTTVSRAISGKGRIGAETRERVLAYIEKHNYYPNPMAKGLAQLRTYNIGWVIPGDSDMTELPFFQRCMMGICQIAAEHDYDLLLAPILKKDMSQLERIVRERKVDGIVLGRTLVKDDQIEFLKRTSIPFVVIGSTRIPDVVQVDNDHISACSELTSILVMKGIKRLALIGGDSNHVVNQTRKKGFVLGLQSKGLQEKDSSIYMDCKDRTDVEHAVENCMKNRVECIVCMDDMICSNVLEKLKNSGISVPEQMKVASFYDSVLLENYIPTITSLQYDPRNLGVVAAKTLFQMINQEPVDPVVYLNYAVTLRDSTQ